MSNVTRGLLRLWLVGSALWAVGITVLYVLAREANLVESIAYSVPGPPLIVLAIGTGLVWAIRGFRS
jgi:hypothetical protein